jgi:hypothetical protein
VKGDTLHSTLEAMDWDTRVERTSILLVVEKDTPCMSILMVMERVTPCTSILLVVKKDPFMSILLAVEMDTPCTSIRLAVEMASTFQHLGQSGTAGHGLVWHRPAKKTVYTFTSSFQIFLI